jgi:hypothetical protein
VGWASRPVGPVGQRSEVDRGACFSAVGAALGQNCRSLQDLAAPQGAVAEATDVQPGQLMAERVMQAAVELALHVLPGEFSKLASAYSSFAEEAELEQGPQGSKGTCEKALQALIPSSAALCDIWPTSAACRAFQRVRPMYVAAALKAGTLPRGRPLVPRKFPGVRGASERAATGSPRARCRECEG